MERLEGVCNTPLPCYRKTRWFFGFHVGVYCIRPTGRHPKDGKCAKRITFFISIMYPSSFLGLGRGLDFLLPSFLVSRQEKKVEARWIRPTEYHFNDDECAKRDTFSRYNDLIIWKRITFLGYSFHRWNVLGAYAIRPYRVTGKRIAFLRYNDLIIRKRITFSISIMYPVNFPGLGRGLDFLLPSFLVSRQEKKVEARWIRPTEYQFNDDEYAKRITFWIFIFDEWWKRGSFSGYIDLVV